MVLNYITVLKDVFCFLLSPIFTLDTFSTKKTTVKENKLIDYE